MSATSSTPSDVKVKTTRKAKGDDRITIHYSLAELPTAQHRAGLAGLVMMIRWLDRQPGSKAGVCTLTRLDDAGATLSLDRDGLRRLFDETYAASKEAQAKKQPWKDKDKEIIPPLRIEERETTDAKGQTKKEKLYYYEQVIPGAGLIRNLEPTSADGTTPWTKLWRDFVWSVLRGVPAQREPFDARAERRDAKDVEETWSQLAGGGDRAVDLPSTYYLGAQAKTAENVSFKDRARYQFLLHFWPYAAQLYVPQVTKPKDGTTEFTGYAVAIPDVAALQSFCEDLTDALRERGTAMGAYRPREAIIDLPQESALDVAHRIRARVAAHEGDRATRDLVLGFEVIHVDKEGNNVRIYGSWRVEPESQMIDEYAMLRGLGLWAPLFKRQRLLNLLAGRRWYHGFDRLIETLSQDALTIGSPAFRHDARISFEFERKHSEGPMNQGEGQTLEPKSLEEVVFLAMQSYVLQKLESKHDLSWAKVKDDPSKKERYEAQKRKIAKDAFLAVRSRTGGAFTDYFAGTLCSVSQHLPKERFLLVSRALQEEPDRIRTLTLLALSAVS